MKKSAKIRKQSAASPSHRQSDHTPSNLNDEEARIWAQMSEQAKQRLQETDLRIRGGIVAKEVWNELLTDDERSRLGDDLEQAWRSHRILGMWMHVKGLTNRFSALVDLAYRLDFLAERHYERLMRESTLADDSAHRPPVRPHFDQVSGDLVLDGEPIRKVRIFQEKPTHVQRIVIAFQNAGWPSSIRNPLDDPHDQQKLHRAIYQLNHGLRRIRFSGSSGARQVMWQLVNDSNSESTGSELE